MRAKMAQREATPGTAHLALPRAQKTAKAARVDWRPAAEADTAQHDSRNPAQLKRSGVQEVLNSAGQPLAPSLRPELESTLGFNLGTVRLHTDNRAAASARALNAAAYTTGSNIVFDDGQFNPNSQDGRSLLTHELTHVAQQGAQNGPPRELASSENSPNEAAANRAEQASASLSGSPSTRTPSGLEPVPPGTVQRKISMRDVGHGEHSGFGRVPALIARLNSMSTGLTFSLTGSDLTYTVKASGTLSNFDTQMRSFIDQAAVLPLRFTNKDGLLSNKAQGFHDRVAGDDWSSGYVDIDDLLAGNDLGLQSLMVHVLGERTATSHYAQPIGTESLNTSHEAPVGDAHQAELDRAHAQGIQAELQVLRGFFNDPSIRLISHDTGEIFRLFRNSRGDTIRTRIRPGRGAQTRVDPVTVEVVTRDGQVHTPEEYLAILAVARQAAVAAPGQHAPPAVPP